MPTHFSNNLRYTVATMVQLCHHNNLINRVNRRVMGSSLIPDYTSVMPSAVCPPFAGLIDSGE
eukprot:m.146874 g.146874  ORF g.146874 m.146874 type:complete len:63 (+) comp11651_c2_seq12:153-341(+)